MKTEIVQVTQGFLQGRKSTTKSGKPLVCFQGIPYAKPPIGSLRFKPPHPPDSWNGIYKAESDPPICLQIDNKSFIGQEDCLYLNVYTQQVKPSTLKPVMFWIHGGGFVLGSGNTDLFGPDYLVDAGVVLVTVNYRLGVLGFLNVGNGDASGNMGLKDQVAALCWVQSNITYFGGDRNNVTIFGESAGAVCVNYHMISPMTKGLFHKAIAQSGSALNPWGFTSESRTQSFILGELLGLKTTDDKELMNFLMNVDAQKLVNASQNVRSKIENVGGLKMIFLPSIEPFVHNQRSYLIDNPRKLLMNGQFHHVPYITGTVTFEGIVNLGALLKYPSLLKAVNEEFFYIIPRQLRVGKTASQIQEMCEKIKKFYFNNAPISIDNMPCYVDYNSDVQIKAGTYAAAKYLASSSSLPVYFYNFSFVGKLGYIRNSMDHGAEIVQGPFHGDDIGYIFRLGIYDPDLDPNSEEIKMREKMITLWTNFAKTGNPTPKLTQQLPIEWLPFTTTHQRHLNIDKEFSIGAYLLQERMTFWEQLYQQFKL